MTWDDLFERAADYDVDRESVRTALEARRENAENRNEGRESDE